MTEYERYRLREIIEESKNIVFFGGAGVSTESGIPDFRSKDGLYNQHDVKFDKYQPEYLLSHSCLYNNPKVFYEFYRQKLDTRNIKPNITHKVLARMEEKGKLLGIITQNIDNLHQMAGSKTVAEIHGTTNRNYCSKCGGLIRPAVTLYEENLPMNEVEKADKLIAEADCLIVGGTSLTVYPAANYVRNFEGKHIVVINRDKIDILLSEDDDLQINDNLGNVFEYINSIL